MLSQFLKRFLSYASVVGLAGVWVLSPQLLGQAQPQSIGDRHHSSKETQYFVQASDVLSILKGIPQPNGISNTISEIFSANAYGQKSLNFEASLKPDDAVTFYQGKLSENGYVEREINRVTGAWGFNLVFDIPDSINLTPEDSSKSIVLVLQGTMLGADMININVRFEEI
ncbi:MULTISPECIES: hypothetical protein [Spirulina sp. CCY15215]|uniref:hypothetical protein n=1 Tax=Spirulina sp. CCY15215 TaxID=2767591 RepID=UPI00194FC20A|nr:hypothetical protein [Spirulina major]